MLPVRVLLILLVVSQVVGCAPRTEASLPDVGTVYTEKDNGVRFRVTWAGTTTYNKGACPEVGTLCVHLIDQSGQPLAAELAVTLDDFRAKFTPVSQ